MLWAWGSVTQKSVYSYRTYKETVHVNRESYQNDNEFNAIRQMI